MFLSWLSLFVFLFSSLLPAGAAPGWVSLPLIGPSEITNETSFYYYVNGILVGTPPATESLLLDIGSSAFAVHSDSCVFCPGTLFNPALSSTYKSKNKASDWGLPGGASTLAQDTISFGGILAADNVPFSLIVRMAQGRKFPRFLDGHLGTFVNASEIANQGHILTRLHSSGALLNPVVGLRLGNSIFDSSISIGALDPNDFEGTINWVPVEGAGTSWESPGIIKVDGIRGFDGSFIPYQQPLLTSIDTLTGTIRLPNVWTYMRQEKYVGPIKTISNDPDATGGSYSFICNVTQPYVHLSVDINGVNYQIDSQYNLLSNGSLFIDRWLDYCNVGLQNFTRTPPSPVSALLGLPFLRSVYLAYRFPTKDCPTAYYGFAFQRGANRTTSMIAQKPRDTPSASAQCLSLVPPTSTPAVLRPFPQESADNFDTGRTYNVWSDPSGRQVRLKGADELVAGVVRGVVIAGD